MFIERAIHRTPPRSSGAKRRPTWVALAENIALRWSAGRAPDRFYKHLAPLEPEHYVIAALVALLKIG